MGRKRMGINGMSDQLVIPGAVGLLFAGSGTLAVANPIDEVLEFLGNEMGVSATMVGK